MVTVSNYKLLNNNFKKYSNVYTYFFQDQLNSPAGITENHLKVTLKILSRYTKVSWIICTDSIKLLKAHKHVQLKNAGMINNLTWLVDFLLLKRICSQEPSRGGSLGGTQRCRHRTLTAPLSVCPRTLRSSGPAFTPVFLWAAQIWASESFTDPKAEFVHQPKLCHVPQGQIMTLRQLWQQWSQKAGAGRHGKNQPGALKNLSARRNLLCTTLTMLMTFFT